LDVQVHAGIVTLSGKSNTLLGKRYAARLAASLKGVRAVVNGAQVLPSGRSDEDVLADVQAAVRDDPVADEEELRIKVADGHVTLEGAVDSFSEKGLVETTVAGVHGVIGIDNQIKVVVTTTRSDSEIKPEILRRFELNPYLAAGLIETEVEDGVVTLSGIVGSASEKSVAGLLCWVAGVREVDDSGLEVKSRLDRKGLRDMFTAFRNDVQIQQSVEDALLYDPRVRGMNITVRSRDGAVSLLGNVTTLAAKRAAERDAKNTLGVRRVINHLKVRPSDWPGDAAVTRAAKEALRRDAVLSDLKLRASSHFGKVYLNGAVNTHFEKHRAEVVIANVPGALGIVNRITVDFEWQPKRDDEIKEDVERRLRWSPFLEADQITVSVTDGVVTLEGIVDMHQQRDAAVKHAHQGRARRVIDELNVRSDRAKARGLK
jgi:osmotically-inducible protein OsmY